MQENECKATLRNSFQWQAIAFLIWSGPLIYTMLTFSQVIYLSPPAMTSFYLFFRVYLLFMFLMLVKFSTLSFFPDVSSSLDEVRKLFTSVSYFHGLIICSTILYNVLFKELAFIYGYTRINHWAGSLGNISGCISAVLFLLRHEYITYWYNPPFGRFAWLIAQFPGVLLVSVTNAALSVLAGNIIWLFRQDFGGYEYFSYVFIVSVVDLTLTKMMQNFIAKPVFLDDQNYLGEELAVTGLLVKDVEVHFQCLQDLYRANHSRKIAIMDHKGSQWVTVLDLALEYINRVPKHIQNFSAIKLRENGKIYQRSVEHIPSALQVFSTYIYFVFNEPFEVKYRNQLFKHFTMAALSSKVLTQFVAHPGLTNYVIRNNSLTLVIQALADSLIELEKYQKIDPYISCFQFSSNLKHDLRYIREMYKEYINSLSLSAETLELIFTRIN